MANKGACEEGDACFRVRHVSVLPETTIESIHVAAFAGNRANRHASADDFSIGDKVGIYIKPFLGAAGRNSKSGNHLIEDQRGVGIKRHAPQGLQEIRTVEAADGGFAPVQP